MSSHSPVAYLAGDESSNYAKMTWRLLPFLFLCAYLDRINVSFAKLQMLKICTSAKPSISQVLEFSLSAIIYYSKYKVI